MTLCVYALIGRRSTLPPARGTAGERLYPVTVGAVTAVVGERRRVPVPSRRALIRYDRAVRALAEHLPAVLPARFGTCFRDLDEVRLVLQSRQQVLRELIAHVRHRAQMTVRIIEAGGAGKAGEARREDAVGAVGGAGEGKASGAGKVGRAGRGGAEGEAGREDAGPTRPTHPTRLNPGTAYLRVRADVAAREREVPGFEPVRGTVRRWIRDERVEKKAGIASVYHLIPRHASEAYRAALVRAATAAGLRVVVTGPWPPYAFTDS